MKTDHEYIAIINDLMYENKMDNSIVSFQKFKPQKNLEKYIEYYWIRKSSSPVNLSAKIIQDGSIIILFLFDAEYNIKMNDENFTKISNANVIGGRKYNTYFRENGLVNALGIRFRPGGFYPFSQIPAKEISDSHVSLKSLFGNEIFEIEERLYEAKSSREKIEIVESFLLNRLSSRVNNPTSLGLQISDIIQSKKGISIDQLCIDTGFYYKKIERIFLEEIGLTPKYLTRILRFQRTLHSLLNNSFDNFSELAYDNFYFDQSHFIKEFEYFTGKTPQNLARYFDSNNSVI